MLCSNSKCTFVLVAVVGAALGVLGSQAFSQNTKDAAKPAGNAAPKMTEKSKDAMGGMPDMPPEMMKYMAAMEECGTPGPVHAEMAKMAGTWHCDCKMWFMPGMPEQTSTGTMTYRTAFGGRVLMGDFEGSYMMGDQKVSMQGLDISGYDNWTGKSWSFWVGSDCTAAWYATGTHDPASKSCSMEGKTPNFWGEKGSTARTRSVMTQIDDNTCRMEMWSPGPDGKEFKGFEMTMTRKK